MYHWEPMKKKVPMSRGMWNQWSIDLWGIERDMEIQAVVTSSVGLLNLVRRWPPVPL
jgi:hypothetical protein